MTSAGVPTSSVSLPPLGQSGEPPPIVGSQMSPNRYSTSLEHRLQVETMVKFVSEAFLSLPWERVWLCVLTHGSDTSQPIDLKLGNEGAALLMAHSHLTTVFSCWTFPEAGLLLALRQRIGLPFQFFFWLLDVWPDRTTQQSRVDWGVPFYLKHGQLTGHHWGSMVKRLNGLSQD